MGNYMVCVWVVDVGETEHTVIGSGISEDGCREAVIEGLSSGDEIALAIARESDYTIYGPGDSLVLT